MGLLDVRRLHRVPTRAREELLGNVELQVCQTGCCGMKASSTPFEGTSSSTYIELKQVCHSSLGHSRLRVIRIIHRHGQL